MRESCAVVVAREVWRVSGLRSRRVCASVGGTGWTRGTYTVATSAAARLRAVARDVARLAAVVARAVALVFVVRQEGRGEGEQGAEAGSGSDETNITTGRQDCRQTYHHRRHRLKQRRPRWYYSCGLWRLVVEVTQGIQYAHSMLKVGRLGAPVRGWFTVYGAVDGVRNTKRIATPTHRRHGWSRSC